jgi:formylglycine-generating enzyme
MGTNSWKSRYVPRLGVAAIFLGLVGSLPLLRGADEGEKAIRVKPTAQTIIPDVKYNWGVFIGINSFHAEGVAPLRFCANDAKSLHDTLTGPGRLIPSEQSFLLTSDRTGKDEPTRVNILKTIKYVCENAKEDSLILISISTHGFTGADNMAYALPKDGDPELLDQTAVSIKTVNDFLTGSKATKKILLVDACREDTARGEKGATKAAMTDRFQETLKSAAGQVTLASCDKDQVSYEDPARGHGVFTYYVLEGLLGSAPANHQGFITVHTLFQYALEKTEAWCLSNRKNVQTPWQYSQISRDIPLAVGSDEPAKVPVVASVEPSSEVKPTTIKPKPPKTEPTPVPQPTPQPVMAMGQASSYLDPSKDFTLDLGNGQKIEMIYLRGGTFRMGTEAGQINTLAARYGGAGRTYQTETPAHNVTLSGFWIGKTEVTNGQYRAFDRKHNSGAFRDRTKAKQSHDLNTDNQPVVDVSWAEAQKFCGWLSTKSGRKCNLPTEAQWEFAARGGTATERYFGDDNSQLASYENVLDQAAATMSPNWKNPVPVNDRFQVTAPVASFQPNPFGLHDMLGNVSEMCRDAYNESFYADAKAAGPNPYNDLHAGRTKDMILRGGSWYSYRQDIRAAFRDKASTRRGTTEAGFRIVVEE